MSDNKRSPLYYEAPTELRRGLAALARGFEPRERAPGRFEWLGGLKLAAASLVTIAAVIVTRSASVPSAEDRVTQEVVASHVRSLMVSSHLTDVPSSERHTVKPWFNGKLDFSPSVADLSAHGFALLGGRLDYLGERPVAALVYQRREHKINLLTWPSSETADAKPKLVSRQGYSVFHWIRAGMNYWAVSDLNAEELRQFSELVLAY
ncbi:MAG: anti-sigma factor [Deltaproteobacteria bacterium]|nr:anti-sigma factor [Deltaproteobacteria bacterium]